MEEQTWNYSGEFLKRAKIIISDKQILLENRELSFMRFPCRNFRENACIRTTLGRGILKKTAERLHFLIGFVIFVRYFMDGFV